MRLDLVVMEAEIKIRRVLDWLDMNHFRKTLDQIGMLTAGAPLYYLNIKDHDYLMITHFNLKRKAYLQGFDLFYVHNVNISLIGKQLTGECDEFGIPSFDVKKDLPLLREFLATQTNEKRL